MIEKKITETNSSNIESVVYDGGISTLVVEFKNGSRYQYSDVPDSVFEKLATADSMGGYFHQHIRGKYDTKRLDDSDDASSDDS